MSMQRKLIVTHHAPDLDAIGAVWFLMRFLNQEFGNAKIAFVNPGEEISIAAAEQLGFAAHEAIHVDTGLGEFDHHQPDRGQELLSASLLVYQHICERHPELKDDRSLKSIADFITEIDHFHEIYWPDPTDIRYLFMIQELIKGMELSDRNSDEAMLQFGMECLDNSLYVMRQRFAAEEEIALKAEDFQIKGGTALAILSSNDDTIKLAQKEGHILVIRKDPQLGNIRIKARPDADLSLDKLRDKITAVDKIGSWYFHPSGKMLINGSQKHTTQQASPLSLEEVVNIIKELYS